jgi:hypothetical protein
MGGADVGAHEPILQLKISLVGVSKPPVWRRLLVPATMRLDRLHEAIQIVMGWQDYHLHAFSAGSVEYGPPDPELGHSDERRTRVIDVIHDPKDRMRYVYDFGDHWQHDIVVEKVGVAEPGVRYPSCVAGTGCCPPEDCGGVWGYADLREALADPSHEQHEDMLEWLGLETADEFDPTAFDVSEADVLLRGRASVA